MKREEYADALKRFLRQKNLKQQDIADKFGVNHATVNNLINGHTYGQAVTLGYIMPDRRKVDEANKAVLALLSGTDAAK